MFYDVFCVDDISWVKFELENFQINTFNVRTFLSGINKFQANFFFHVMIYDLFST